MVALTIRHLREVLSYDRDSGVFTWRKSLSRSVPIGTVAGKIRKRDGRRAIKIDGTAYIAARLAFFYVKGRWPKGDIDHRDGDRLNDKWKNLREATRSQNVANRDTFPHSSAFKGVSFDKQTGRWRARIRVRGKLIALGRHDTPEQAHAAYVAAARKYFGEFARP